jgi:predicted enzyme related to lactoylglutathione lyase
VRAIAGVGFLRAQRCVRLPGVASRAVHAPEGSPNGSLIEADEAGLAIGVAVADLGASIANAVELGGTVRMPPTDNGWVVKAQIVDPAGNVLMLIQQ